MQRLASQPRPDWQAKFAALGFAFHSADGGYWNEAACYRFSADEIDELEAATQELQRLALAAVKHVVGNAQYERMQIPAEFQTLVGNSWLQNEPSLYGRFDLAYDGRTAPKLLEYNADTPTSLLEAAVAQWQWLEETGRPDQFNSLHEKLIERWRTLGAAWPQEAVVHFSCVKDNEEDRITLEYLRDTAVQAGLTTGFAYMEDLGWDGASFVDAEEKPITAWFKLYPYEWIMREPFGAHLPRVTLDIVEPPWKALLSNKAILATLWELFPDHPNLLPAYLTPDYLGSDFVKKPFFSREGANVSFAGRRNAINTEGPYGAEGYVYQARAELPQFDGNYPVIGSWVVGDEAAGIGIREDVTPITTNRSRFVPHFFD
ncbi:MAG: glutathionylspermidine synthase [Betaproteobacteria bacterium]|nr:glutathionylspermidine synthase [Betaproteobacteria bacterium]